MKAELPEVTRHTKKPFDWAKVKGAAGYGVALARRKRTEAAAAALSAAAAPPAAMTRGKKFDKWEEGPMELARRIWGWWRARLCGVDLFKYWPMASRLVALMQTPSARMERAFSQPKLIFETIGYMGLEKTAECRLFVRMNKGQYGQ